MQQTNNNMLDESSKLLAQIKNASKVKEIQRMKRKYYYTMFKKWSIRIFLVFVLASVVLYPVESGTVLGTWIHDFFGTTYKNIVK